MELLPDERLVELLPEERKFDDELDVRLEEELPPEERKFDDELREELDDELDTVPRLVDDDELELTLIPSAANVFAPAIPSTVKPFLR